MKKTFLILATLLLMGSTAFAGGDFDFAIGPKVGYQTTKLSYYKADIKSSFSNHFTAGIFTRFTIGKFYIQPELLYLALPISLNSPPQAHRATTSSTSPPMRKSN